MEWTSSTDIFKHVEKAHTDLSKPAVHLPVADKLAWGYQLESFDPDVDHKDEHLENEKNSTLTILTPDERFMLAADNTLAMAYNDIVALAFNERYAQGSIGIKGKGREQAITVVGVISQKISMPTTLQKIARKLTGKGGKVEEEETTDGVAMGE